MFWGLTIGFGTGFVGTGGGMMMLVVFTVFLGMDLKTAVGTSTFIMTFTALIASFSHILIHPAIILEKWDVMVICIVCATASSLFSARFANRVNSRTVGLVTGAVLTVLGGAMLMLYFWPEISSFPLAVQTLACLGNLILYIIPCVVILLPIRIFTGVPSFVFRKLLHMIAFTCFTVMSLSAQSWLSAALTSVIIAIAVYPLLSLLENEKWYGRLFVQKSPGEIKRSLLKLFFMFAVVIAVSWGIFHKPYAAAASIMMWGVGDAVAALVGIPFGKHKITIKPLNGKKSWEGSSAMLVISTLTGVVLLKVFGGYTTGISLLAALTMGFFGTVAELCSPSEWDTVTVPVTMLVFALLIL